MAVRERAFWMGTIRENYWERHILGRHVTYTRKSRNAPMGRFGGGWNWNLGFQAGGRTVIINLLTVNIRIERKKK